MKFIILCMAILISSTLYAQEDSNIIKIYATMIPNSGSFVAVSNKARGRLLKIDEEFKADRLSVFADSFKTENSLRDIHLAKFLSGGSDLPHPRIDIINLVGKLNKASATIVINGIKKELQLDYIVNSNHVEVTFNLNTRDFNLVAPSYLGVIVSENVKIEVKYYWEVK